MPDISLQKMAELHKAFREFYAAGGIGIQIEHVHVNMETFSRLVPHGSPITVHDDVIGNYRDLTAEVDVDGYKLPIIVLF